MCYSPPTHRYAWKEVKKVMAGSIEKRKGDSYRLVYFAGYNLKGKPIKKTQTVHCQSLLDCFIYIIIYYHITTLKTALIQVFSP